MSPRAALAARIAFAAGLRAHELFSIRPANELQASSHRSWSPDRFAGREGELFVVAGKGGLRREVMLPHALAAELKSRRFEDGAVAVRDRGINYQRHYDIAGGQSLSDVWNRASSKELIYGKLNEPPNAFVKLTEAILEILPDAEVKTESVEKIEELEEPAGMIERIEEPLPAPAAPTAEKRSLAARLWKN